MFNIKPENLVGDTNKLLFAILVELQQLNKTVESLRPIAMDTVISSIVEQVAEIIKPIKAEKPKRDVTKNVNSLGQTRKLSKAKP